MTSTLNSLDAFKKICRNICMNIPATYLWQWDGQRNMAVVVLEEQDAEMVFYPLFKEFRNHWSFSSLDDAADKVNKYIHAEFGLMPGQVFFTSHKVGGAVLGVAWWPWGNNEKVSMRVGLIPVDVEFVEDFAYTCLSRWLNIDSQAAQNAAG